MEMLFSFKEKHVSILDYLIMKEKDGGCGDDDNDFLITRQQICLICLSFPPLYPKKANWGKC